MDFSHSAGGSWFSHSFSSSISGVQDIWISHRIQTEDCSQQLCSPGTYDLSGLNLFQRSVWDPQETPTGEKDDYHPPPILLEAQGKLQDKYEVLLTF